MVLLILPSFWIKLRHDAKCFCIFVSDDCNIDKTKNWCIQQHNSH